MPEPMVPAPTTPITEGKALTRRASRLAARPVRASPLCAPRPPRPGGAGAAPRPGPPRGPGRGAAPAPPGRGGRGAHSGDARTGRAASREARRVSALPSVIGVVGAGTMGSGIAQLGAAAGIETRLHDPDEAALEKGIAALGKGLAKLAEKGRLDGDPDEAAARVTAAASLDDLAGCELVIEAAPERPDLKRELFSELSGICGEDAVLATNTSSIPVTSLAGAAARPDNVVGMHFFNPPPLMKLLEVIPAEQTGERALAMATATGEAMGRRVIVAADGPGFLVNRCGRPFGAEALRIVQEGIATPEQVDRICRVGGGFRMGPFELMDLVGIDVGFEVAKSFNDLSFGEHRWKPSPLQARMVDAGRLGRKTGRPASTILACSGLGFQRCSPKD